jgi:hypothetical protein
MKRLSMVKVAGLAASVAVAVGGAASARAAGADQAPPAVSISTPNNAVRFAGVGEQTTADATRTLARTGAPVRPSRPDTQISGQVSDDRSGVMEVRVLFAQCVMASATETSYSCSGMLPQTALHNGGDVAVSCSDESRTSCAWSVGAPIMPGHYLVSASAVDRAGHAGKFTRPVFVVVI